MEKRHPRIAREQETIRQMAFLYCHEVHHTAKGNLCSDCKDLMNYALERLRKCPFQERKSTCAKCTVHCYKPVMREKVRVVMRYAGPRMLLHHPILAIRHLMDGRREPPVLERRSARSQKSEAE